MRLVSAIFHEYYPFNHFHKFHNFIATSESGELREGDVLLVWGGADIPPEYYGKNKSIKSWAATPPTRRDTIEWELMQRAKELGLPIIGICRGAQMLCALAGGYLIQHVNNHAGANHPITTDTGEQLNVNSLHHQMMLPKKPDGSPVAHEVWGVSSELRSREYWDENNKVDHIDEEPEFLFFNDIKGFAIQWHPEMMPKNEEATQFIFKKLEERLGN